MKRIIPALFCAIVLLFPSSVAAKSKKAPKAAAKSSFEKINLNEVSEYDLKQIPGISASKAKALLAYRDEKGEIKSIEELKEINHETKSGKTSYDFATSKGAWTKPIKLLMDADVFTVSGGVGVVDQNALYKHLFPKPRDINSASSAELTALPGISKANAQHLIDNRPFSSIDGLKDISYETKSGKTGYAFATSKGVWKKDIKILIDSGRLVCAGSTKSSKKAAPAKESKSDEQDDGQEESDEPEEY